MTKPGRYVVTFSIPSSVFNSFVAFQVEDILELENARLIERALLDGGCPSVYVSVKTDNPKQPFVAIPPCELLPGFVAQCTQKMSDEFLAHK